MNLIPEIVALAEEHTDWRHHLHADPETCFEEFSTAKFVTEKLESFGLEVKSGLATTGLYASLKCGTSDRSIALRADMDALNMDELNEFNHVSRNPGKMHGCGHDGHMVMLLAAAQHLCKTKDFDGTVHFVFQPAEEGGGGAKVMMDEGLFNRIKVDDIYALHNMPGVEVGKMGSRKGPFLASTAQFNIKITGTGGHGAFSDLASSPILPACKIVSAINEFLGYGISAHKKLTMSVGFINSGTATNVIPETAELGGTVRSLDVEAEKDFEAAMHRISKGICEAYNTTCEVDYRRNYPVLVNTDTETEKMRSAAAQIVGDENVDIEADPVMGSEDFAYFLQDKPGNYAFIGNGVGEDGGCFVHNPRYDFNDDIISLGASYWVKLVQQELT